MDTNIQLTQNPTANTTLPQGFTERAATASDAGIIAALINVYDLAVVGKAETTINSVREDWRSHQIDPQKNIWLVFSPEGKLVGLEECTDSRKNGKIGLDGYVHPDYTGRGIGTYLMRWAAQQAQTYAQSYAPDVRLSVLVNTHAADLKSIELFKNEGYKPVRHFWRMEIKMSAQPQPPEWPDGTIVRTYIRGNDDRAVYNAGHEAFLDHWNYTQVPFEDWINARTGSPKFDPGLWFLAIDKTTQQIIGLSLCKVRPGDTAWITTLGVVPAWRKKGIGMALLRHTFNQFYNRGFHIVGLGVDTANLTDATRLYERAGMYCTMKFEAWEKELRPAR